MLNDIRPFRMAEGLYFVGNSKVCSHLIDTGEGLILIDTGYPQTADAIVEAMESLGFGIGDVKLILHSHGHWDHTGGTKKLAGLSGAKTMLHEDDLQYLRGHGDLDWLPDAYLHDGDVIRLGNKEILCRHTPGHTWGVMSFFFDVELNGRVYRAGTFGGAGTKQVKKNILEANNLSTYLRKHFYESIEMLRGEHVDLFFGNHAWHNDTAGKSMRVLAGETDACIDPGEWIRNLDRVKKDLDQALRDDAHATFVNYAHRGASEYAPEAMPIAFSLGILMGANGVETDVRRTGDGQLVLYHDNTLAKAGLPDMTVAKTTMEDLRKVTFEHGGFKDRLITLEDFLRMFGFQDIRFAIELKEEGIAADTAALLRKYGMERKTTVTSFSLAALKEMKACAPEFKLGYLVGEVTPEVIRDMYETGIEEVCPKASSVTPGRVYEWHCAGFNVRAWGVANEELMRNVYDSFCDGTTVNFPDKLKAYIASKAE